jgi:hypothetical protein
MSRVQWQEAQLPPLQELHPELALEACVLASCELSDALQAKVLKSFETLRELHWGQRVLSL